MVEHTKVLAVAIGEVVRAALDELHRTLVLTVPVAVFLHRDDVLVYVNPVAVRLCSEPDAASLLQRKLEDVVSPPRAPAAPSEREIRTGKGERISVEWTSVAIDFQHEQATLSLAVDISSRKRGETARARASDVPKRDHAQAWRRTGTVLIADDEPRVRQVLAMMLTDIGFQVLEAATTSTCLEVYRAHAKAIDAVMVDLEMPGGGGREVVRVLRAEGHRVPVVVSSGYGEDAIEREMRDDPRLAFLEKPFEFSKFVRTLKDAMEQRARE